MGVRLTSPFIVSFGEEEFLLDRDLQSYRSQPDRTVTILDGDGLEDHDLVTICETNIIDLDDPAATKPRIVVVDDAQEVKAEKALRAYVEKKDSKDLSVVLALIVRDPKLPSIWTKLGSKGAVREHKKFKTFETNNEVVKWMLEEARSIGLSLDSRTATGIFQVVGYDLYRISNELQKLLLLAGSGVPVTIEHIKLVLTQGNSVEPYHVADAVAAKDPKKAMNALSSLYRTTGEDPAVPVAYSLMRQVEKLLVARTMLDRGAGPEEVAGQLNMHPWRCKSFFLPLVGKHTRDGLIRAMHRLCKLDVEIKSGSLSKRTRLELAVLSIAT